jgi:S1-C subfamily serine protease
VDTGLRAIGEAAVHLPTGGRAPARYVAHDGRLGIVLFRADLGNVLGAGPTVTAGPTPLPPAPPDAYVEGRIVLALGNPFGARPHADPLLTFGILSKRHAPDVPDPWRGQWQTDAGATDANCGGAVVDLKGRLLGMLQVWSPPRHGRNSGIGFVVGYDQIAASLPALKEGRSLVRGVLGVNLDPAASGVVLQAVVPDSPAARAGLRAGDRILAVGEVEVADVQRFRGLLLNRWAGDRVRIRYERDGEEAEVEVELAAG